MTYATFSYRLTLTQYNNRQQFLQHIKPLDFTRHVGFFTLSSFTATKLAWLGHLC